MKIKKKTLLLALAAVTVAAFVLFQFYAAYALPKMDEESMTLSKEIEASGKPSGILADFQSCKDGMIPVVDKAEGCIAISAKAAPILFAGECSVKLYYVHDKENCGYLERNQICTAEDYGSCIVSEGLKKNSAGYYVFTIENLDTLDSGHYYIAFWDKNNIRNASMDFILE